MGLRLAGTPLRGLVRSTAILTTCLISNAGLAESYSHVSAHPEIQMWTYPNASAAGGASVQSRGPTFAAFLGEDSGTGQTVPVPGSGAGPSRLASVLVATDTSQTVPTGLPPSQYQVDSLRVTVTLVGSLIYEPAGYTLPYDNTLDDLESLINGTDDPGRPIEMYGVGLQGDYSGFGFDDTADPATLQLGDPRWRRFREGEEGYIEGEPAAGQPIAPYQFYAVDAQGRDAENSISGGYSATDPTGETEPFFADALAVGKVYGAGGEELTPGTLMNSGDQLIFEPNLANPGILSYVQQSLANGALGFMFSSLHEPGGQAATAAYPDFYLDDLDVGNNPDGAAPLIELSVTVGEALPGDYDGDGVVDALDYALWREQFGGPGPEADGNGDGTVDAADYTVWRDNLPPASAATAAPEPSSVAMLGLFGVAMAFCGWAEWFVRPNRNGEG